MTKKELESKTVLELRALAKKLKITLRAKRKADIIKELMAGAVPAPKKETKPVTKKKARKAVPTAKKETKPTTKKETKTKIKAKTLSKGAVPPAEEKTKPTKKKAVPTAKKETKPTTKKRAVPTTKKEAKEVVPSPKKEAKPAKKKAVPPTEKGAVPPAEEKAKEPKKKAKVKSEIPTKEKAEPKAKKKVSKVEAKTETPVKKTPIRQIAVSKTKEPSVPKVPPKHLPILPPEPEAEYGEDMVTAISVEPTKIFVFWELKESTIKKIGGNPFLRIYDITGIEDKSQAHSFFDIDCKNRIGSRYIDLQEDKEYIVEIGLSTKKGFIPIAQSQRTSTFRARPQALKEPLIPEEYLDYLTPPEEGSIPR